MAFARMTAEQAREAPGRVDMAKIEATTEEDIRRHMIEDGQYPDAPLGPYRVVWPGAEVRKLTGLTQAASAKAINVPAATIRNWEQGRTIPDSAVQSSLAPIADDPHRAFEVLRTRMPRIPTLTSAERDAVNNALDAASVGRIYRKIETP